MNNENSSKDLRKPNNIIYIYIYIYTSAPDMLASKFELILKKLSSLFCCDKNRLFHLRHKIYLYKSKILFLVISYNAYILLGSRN